MHNSKTPKNEKIAMKRLLFILLSFCFGYGTIEGQSVTVTSTYFAATFVFNLDTGNSPDATGRNVYYYSNSGLEIRYNNGASRWEIRARGGNFDVYYINTFASSPNPPDSGTSAWDDFGYADGTGNATVTGSGTQTTIGGDPCDGLGGDTDGDGACDDNDICPGSDDFADQDSDGIPDGCDNNPTIPDGVLVDASCLDPDPILFTLSGTDGTGRNVYNTVFFNGLEVRYNSVLGRWEVRASSGAMDVYLYNTFASWPDPPGSAGSWVGTPVLNCNTAPTPTINGSGTQNTLGCVISIGTPSVTQPPCGGDGVISVTASGARGSITYSLKQGLTTVSSNGSGVFVGLDAGTYTIVASDGAFPAGVCEASTGSMLLVIQDATPPTASNPATANVQCAADVPAPNPAVVTDEADNCGIPTVSHVGDTDNGGLGNLASPLIITRTYRVTDAAGNTKDVAQTINVVDDTPPTITCPGNIVKMNDTGLCSAVVTYGTPTSSDNCGPASVSLIGGLASGSVFPIGMTTVRYEATDAVANTRECEFTVTVNDMEDPLIVCPSNIVKSNDAGLCSAVVTYTPPVGIDNCPGAITTQTGGLGTGATFPVGETTETYLVRDAAGNIDDCSFTVTVKDAEAPVLLTCPGNIVVDNDPGLCGARVDYALPTFSDNCVVTGLLGNGWDPGDLFPVGTTTVQYNGFDAAANQSELCSFTVTVNDVEAPTMTCIDEYEVNLDDDGSIDLLEGIDAANWALFVSSTFITSASDNCDLNGFVYWPSLVFNCDNAPSGVRNIRLFVQDVNGLSGSCVVKIIVNDPLSACNQAPVASCKAITVAVDANCEADISASQINDGSSDPDGDPLDLSLDNNGPFSPGVYTVELTVSDGQLEDKCTATVTVRDDTDPAISCPADIVQVNDPFDCGAVVTYTPPTGVDNCTGATTSKISGLGSGARFPVGTTTETYRVTDAAGNIDDCSFTVTVNDLEIPDITCPADEDVQCLEDVPSPNTLVVSASDNCGAVVVNYEGDSFIGSSCSRTITRTYRATDGSGNQHSCEQTIKVEDTTPPVLVIPANTTIECDESDAPTNTGQATATDNCSAAAAIDISLSDRQINILGADCYTIERTWTATDECNKSTSKVQYITVEDTTPPSFTNCPSDKEVDCVMAIPAVSDPTAVDNCAVGDLVTYLGEVRDNSCGSDYYTLTRSWKAEDNCGNTKLCEQEIKVNTILSDDCFNITLDLSYNAASKKTTFRWELCVEDSKCQDLSHIDFSLPCDLPKNGVTGAETSFDGGVSVLSGKPGRNRCSYAITFENFAPNGGIKGEPGGCVVFYYTLDGDYRKYETDVDIKAGRERGLGFSGIGASCDCDGSVPYNSGGSLIAEADAYELAAQLLNDPFQAAEATLRAYPNPASGNMTIEFAVPETTEAIIDLYDMQGRRLGRIFEQEVEAGVSTTTRIERRQLQLPQGTYLYLLRAGGYTLQGKIVFLN